MDISIIKFKLWILNESYNFMHLNWCYLKFVNLKYKFNMLEEEVYYYDFFILNFYVKKIILNFKSFNYFTISS